MRIGAQPSCFFVTANLIDEKQHELLGCNGCGTKVDSETLNKIADFLNQQLTSMTPSQRLLGDLSVTSEPKKRVIFTPTSKVEDFDPVENYSATYEWLVMFRDFCRSQPSR